MHFSVALLLLILPLGSALTCSPGTFSPNPSTPCKPCPKGTYQFFTAEPPIRCIECPPGTYFPFRSGRGKDVCIRCPSNTFSTATGARSSKVCQPCPPGKVSAPGSAACFEPCGTCQILTRDGCETCETKIFQGFCSRQIILAREYCDGKNIVTCPLGFRALKRARKCARCFSCLTCPLGLTNRMDILRCVPCPAGTETQRYTRECLPCPPGQNTNGSRPVCVDDGTPCPSNFFENADGNCDTCATGERFDAKNKVCVKCKEGETSVGGITEKCKSCGPNKIFRQNRLGRFTCECRSGFFRNTRNRCVPCPPGSIPDGDRCEKCPVGFFSKNSSMPCTACPEGMVQPEIGKDHCIECKRGLIPSTLLGAEYPSTQVNPFLFTEFSRFEDGQVTRSDCVNPRTNCPPHLRRVTDGKNFFCEPKECPPGTRMTRVRHFGSFRGRVLGCLPCPPRATLRDGVCSFCTDEDITAGRTNKECEECPRREIRNAGKCSCGGSVFFRNKKGMCRRCPPGTMPDIFDDRPKCLKCAKGTVPSKREIPTICEACEAGTVEVGRVRCKKCPDGFTSFGVQDKKCVKIGGR